MYVLVWCAKYRADAVLLQEFELCWIAEQSTGHVYILMEARLCELYKSAEEYQINERFDVFNRNLS